MAVHAITVLSFLLYLLFCICNNTRASSDRYDYMQAASDSHGYKDALGKAILFFEGQRSGKLPQGQRVKWRGDSAVSDGSNENVSKATNGGYYDAGDNVKFTWPMAFSVSLLSWAAVENGNDVNSTGQMDNLRAAIRWGTEFLIRAHAASTTLYTQVGEANKDHACWERPEDMDTPRTLYKITATSLGSEVAADTAAALAAASIVFKWTDAKYSATLLQHSKELFEFGDKYRGSYAASCPFYCSYSGYQDELLWAAAWLYKATGDDIYRHYASDNQGWSHPTSEFSWDNKLVGAQTLLAKEFLAGRRDMAEYKNGADSFVCSLMPGSSSVQIKTTPGGLLFTRDSSNLQYATSASMVLLVYSKTLSAARVDGVQCGSVKFSTSKIRSFAQSQVDYILGNNPMKMSYIVGFGTKYPTQLHHRASSIPSIGARPAKVGCNDGQTWFSSSKPNPNVHVGAVVGGPYSNDRFNDARSEYARLEPTTYMNAAFVGSVAALLGQTKEARSDSWQVADWSNEIHY